jgi:hypothetical protein
LFGVTESGKCEERLFPPLSKNSFNKEGVFDRDREKYVLFIGKKLLCLRILSVGCTLKFNNVE